MTCVVITAAELKRLQRAEQKAQVWQFFTCLMAAGCLSLGVLVCITGQSHDRMAEKVVRQELALQR